MSSDNQNKRARSENNEEGSDDWKTQPPYQANEEMKGKKAVLTGSCHCGDVKYEIYADKPLKAHFCHCSTCHKIHGSAMHWSAVLEKTDVLFKCSTDKMSFYRTEDQTNKHELPAKMTCVRCKSPICDEGRGKILMYPSLFDFDKKEDQEAWMPSEHVFYSNRSIEIEDGKDKWTKMPDSEDSEKMDEKAVHGRKGAAGSGNK